MILAEKARVVRKGVLTSLLLKPSSIFCTWNQRSTSVKEGTGDRVTLVGSTWQLCHSGSPRGLVRWKQQLIIDINTERMSNWTQFQHQIKNNVAIFLVRLSKKYFVTLKILSINRSSFEGNRKDTHKNFIFQHKVLFSCTKLCNYFLCASLCCSTYSLSGRKYVGKFHCFANWNEKRF